MNRALPILAALAVAACSKKPVPEEIATEAALRDAFRSKVLREEDAGRAEAVSSRPDVVFEDGFGKVLYDPPDNYRNVAIRWMGQNAHARLKSHGDKRMRLRIVGWVDDKHLLTWPYLTVFLDGMPVGAPLGPIDKGFYWFEAEVPPEMFRGQEWADLNVRLSTVAYHWYDPPDLGVALVSRFDWEEIP